MSWVLTIYEDYPLPSPVYQLPAGHLLNIDKFHPAEVSSWRR